MQCRWRIPLHQQYAGTVVFASAWLSRNYSPCLFVCSYAYHLATLVVLALRPTCRRSVYYPCIYHSRPRSGVAKPPNPCSLPKSQLRGFSAACPCSQVPHPRQSPSPYPTADRTLLQLRLANRSTLVLVGLPSPSIVCAALCLQQRLPTLWT